MERMNGLGSDVVERADLADLDVEDAEVVRRLHDLAGARAPGSLLPAVLAKVGLAEVYAPLHSPLGPVYVAYNRRGVSGVRLGEQASEFERWFEVRFGRPVRPVAVLPAALTRSLTEQLRGGKRPGLRIDLRGLSEFERAVLRKTLDIPRGEVRPYAWVAREIGRPGAVRAVGAALANNPVPLLIPCHRVVRSDGNLGDYVFGPEVKRAVLEMEGAELARLQRLAQSGVRFLGSDTTRIYCFPTCRNARRITEQHQVPFGTEAEAAAADYRPCRVCRPSSAA